MTTVSEVPSVMDGLAGKIRFRLLQSVDDLNVEVWHLMQDSNLEQIFGKSKEKLKGLLIPRSKIDELYKSVAESGNVQDYSMLFLFNYHGRYKVLEVRRTTGLNPHLEEHVISNKDWILKSQDYVLIVPKLA